MKPHDESLTPLQQRVFSTILLLITLAFSSVFAFAYWKGTQAQANRSTQTISLLRMNRLKHLRLKDLKRTALRIPRGATGRRHPGHTSQTSSTLRTRYNWTVSKLTDSSENTTLSIPPVIAYTSSSNGWRISRQGDISVPSQAELGLYLAHYCEGNRGRDVFFEVLPTPPSRSTSSLHPTSGTAKTGSSSPS